MNRMYLLKTLVFVLLIVLANSDVWAIRNDQIASVALQHNGEGGFTCKEFIQHVFTHLGGSLGAGYRQCYFDFPGGREITNVVEVIRGDIVQVSDDVDEEDTIHIHSAIVLENLGNGNFKVVHSNWCDPPTCETVSVKDSWNPSDWASKYTNYSAHFYRLGTVVGLFFDGWHSGISDRILASYTANGGESVFGHPFDNNSGTAFVHRWPEQGTEYVIIQDFAGGIYGTDKQCAIVYNPNVNSAFLLKEGFFIS